jgi:hypothetical protein
VTATKTSLLIQSFFPSYRRRSPHFRMRHRVIGGCNRIYFVEHAASISRMETSRHLLPANLDTVGRTTAEADSHQSVPHRGGPGSVSGQRAWDLWRTGWRGELFCFEYFGFPLSVSFLQCSISHSSVTRVTKTLAQIGLA